YQSAEMQEPRRSRWFPVPGSAPRTRWRPGSSCVAPSLTPRASSSPAVAGAAGVSRQRLYTEFGSREAFARALILNVSDRLIGAVEGAMDDHLDDPRAALLAAFELFLAVAAADPLARIAITGDGEMLPVAATRGRSLLERSSERLKSAI